MSPKDPPVEILERAVPHRNWSRLVLAKQTLEWRDARIREMYATMDKHSLDQVARVFGLSHEQVRNIVRGDRSLSSKRIEDLEGKDAEPDGRTHVSRRLVQRNQG